MGKAAATQPGPVAQCVYASLDATLAELAMDPQGAEDLAWGRPGETAIQRSARRGKRLFNIVNRAVAYLIDPESRVELSSEHWWTYQISPIGSLPRSASILDPNTLTRLLITYSVHRLTTYNPSQAHAIDVAGLSHSGPGWRRSLKPLTCPNQPTD